MKNTKYIRVERRIADRQARRLEWRQSGDNMTTHTPQRSNQATASYLAVLSARRSK